MSRSIRHKSEVIHVVDESGRPAQVLKVTPVVTESTFDGPVTWDMNATLSLGGEHVNRIDDSTFETISGVRWHLRK